MTKRIGGRERSTRRRLSATVCVVFAAVLTGAELHAQRGAVFLPAETPSAAEPAPGVTVLRSLFARVDFGVLAAARAWPPNGRRRHRP